MKAWYKTLLVLWVLLMLPSIILAYGFSGGDLKGMFDLSGLSIVDVVVFALCWLLFASPVLFALVGIQRRE
jgi:hypothetical protein